MKSLLVVTIFFAAGSAMAQEHRVEALDEAPPTEGVTEDILQQISPTGFRIVRGTSRTVCDIWLCNEWKSVDGFKQTANLLYPFERGQLIGLMRFPRRGNEFRNQRIDQGVYTLRFGLQPMDGNHEGTSPTRDFVLLVRTEDDESSEKIEFKKLLALSSKAAGSAHPAMFCLQRILDQELKTPSIRHNEEHDWWIVQLEGNLVAGEKKSKLPIALIVAGHANE